MPRSGRQAPSVRSAYTSKPTRSSTETACSASRAATFAYRPRRSSAPARTRLRAAGIDRPAGSRGAVPRCIRARPASRGAPWPSSRCATTHRRWCIRAAAAVPRPHPAGGAASRRPTRRRSARAPRGRLSGATANGASCGSVRVHQASEKRPNNLAGTSAKRPAPSRSGSSSTGSRSSPSGGSSISRTSSVWRTRGRQHARVLQPELAVAVVLEGEGARDRPPELEPRLEMHAHRQPRAAQVPGFDARARQAAGTRATARRPRTPARPTRCRRCLTRPSAR